MAIYLYLGCVEHKVCVALSRSGSSGNGPLAGDEYLYKFLDAHEFCPMVKVISDSSDVFDEYTDIKEKAPTCEGRG